MIIFHVHSVEMEAIWCNGAASKMSVFKLSIYSNVSVA